MAIVKILSEAGVNVAPNDLQNITTGMCVQRYNNYKIWIPGESIDYRAGKDWEEDVDVVDTMVEHYKKAKGKNPMWKFVIMDLHVHPDRDNDNLIVI